ncbi:DUF389 domain-containing protein [Flavobacterium branchiicola]|uniref:DUF389 domain-containing protein n=1 Tax=Flavobacterium branchiicola TaxID=1114875 RepID=A0ABV9P9J2_9FLAO|nr:DUF389 domain-containing protein [Flavobacterium branchiicola]MBS7253614.1 DUF389 domain-containing protein [Flavobacterium branchiicola]
MKDLRKFIDLHDGEDDREKTLAGIKKNVDFKGSNLWILACAIIVASVGLNVNSTAVIIGAMLISPLMGPIVGAGFALGIYDFVLLKRSLKNLFIATIVSLSVSTIYFMLSPFKDVQSELLARTSPNIYDILIAFFGGIVGVIAVTRTEKGNPIAGVAIATALMPPLCTAGYGLATGQWSFFFGAFYLYCINCVFIGIATFLIIKYLRYSPKVQVDAKKAKQVKIIISVLIAVMILPSSYLAYSLYKQQKFSKSVDSFIENEFTQKGFTVIFKKIDFNANPKKVELAFLSKYFEKSDFVQLDSLINANQDLKGIKLVIRQDNANKLNVLKGDILNQIKNSENTLNAKDIKILQLQKELSSANFDNRQLLNESRILFPSITSLSVSKNNRAEQEDKNTTFTAVIYASETNLNTGDKEKFKNWLNKRLAVTNIEIFRKE